MRIENEKTTLEKLDETFNEMRNQLDFLVKSAEYQNEILKNLYEINNDSCNSSN